jgi:hypothetical protein
MSHVRSAVLKNTDHTQHIDPDEQQNGDPGRHGHYEEQ